ncbi:MAG: rod shape-determining protein MreC [Chthoniobacterales bacterium]|nr:rod shape-determining protein MreC [Chthoniobacterales bacterium]
MNKLHLVLLALAVLVALVFLAFSPERMKAWQSRFLDVSTPALKAGSALSTSISKLNTGLKTLDELEAENAVLTAQNSELRATNQLLGELDAENRRLRSALAYSERSAFRLLPAEIISRDASSWWNTVKINRGFAEGLDSAQPVLTAEGLVGRTTTVAKDVTIVMLLTDENCQVAARVEGTNEQGILSGRRVTGNAAPELVLNFLNRDADLQPGMKVFTAGVSGAVFPAGILLGEIKEFRTRELDGQALVAPAADFSRLEDVFVVLGTR